MKTIHKFAVTLTPGIVQVLMPKNAEILTFQHDASGHPKLWALVDPAKPMQERRFEICWTGKSIQDLPSGMIRKYIGTVLTGPIVSHLFELTEK
jgi:hypothetical protein